MHLFRHRERRLNPMRKALKQASMRESRIKYSAISTELKEVPHKLLMAHEREKSFANKCRSLKKVSGKPIKTFDNDLDKLM